MSPSGYNYRSPSSLPPIAASLIGKQLSADIYGYNTEAVWLMLFQKMLPGGSG